MEALAKPLRVASQHTQYRHVGWAAVYAANLPLALWLGNQVTREGGRTGMCVGVLSVWLLGHRATARVRGLNNTLLIGGVCTAVAQGFGVLHIIAGLFALKLLGPTPGRLTEWEGFLATLLTAWPLVLAALVCGTVLRELRRPLANSGTRRRG